MTDEDFQSLVTRYLEDALDESEVMMLGRELDRYPARVQQFNDLRILTGLIHEHGQSTGEQGSQFTRPTPVATAQRTRSKWLYGVLSGSLAASILVIISFSLGLFTPSTIATLVSVENASWESSLPTVKGSKLGPGILNLKSGIGTVRFRSGVVVTLQAPSALELLSPMRARMLVGSASIEVPDSAIGFIMETPNGYAVDHGTEFSVTVDPSGDRSSFEVIEGEISVQVTSTGESARLIGQGKAVTLAANSLVTRENARPERGPDPGPEVVRIGTGGREGTAIRNDAREYISPRYLTVNRLFHKEWDRRSFFAFDLSSVDLDQVRYVTLRLNLVPFPYGIFGVLPERNRYAVYGLTNPEKAAWKNNSLWKDSPGPEDGVLIGTFDVPRSQQQGSFTIGNKELRQFLMEHGEGEVTFIVVRENLPIKQGDVPCHAFAGKRHPEANGPRLEFGLVKNE